MVGGPPLQGRVCIVTGASRGIGLETARGLAALGGEVALVSRDPGAGEAARKSVAGAPAEAAGVEPAFFACDFASLESVRDLAGRLAARYPRVHVLVNNAGIFVPRRRVTEDGNELTIAVNHLAPFLLTNLLLGNLLAAGAARVITVSSAAHHRARDLGDFQSERRYSGVLAYARSKLANILFAVQLAGRLAGTGVVSNALHPGMVRTRLLGDAVAGRLGWRFPYHLAKFLFRSPRQGAATGLYLAAAPEAGEITGCYFEDERPARPSRAAQDAELAGRVWDLSARLTGLAGTHGVRAAEEGRS